MARQENFEILGQRGNSWTILDVLDDKQAAVARSEQLSRKYAAVKVVREFFDEASGMFQSFEVCFHGTRRKPSKFDDDGAPPITCWKVQDFFSFEGRRTISRLLRDPLQRHGITATELVHSAEYIDLIEAAGTVVQAAVQRAAIAQVRDTGDSVQRRVRELYDLIARGSEIVRKDWAQGRVPTLEPDRFDDLVARLGAGSRRTYLLNSALVGYLADADGLHQKLVRVLALFRPDHEPWVHEVIDSFVGELLSGGVAIQGLLGPQPDRGHALAAMADLAHGTYRAPASRPAPDAERLAGYIGAGHMPLAKTALEDRLIDGVKSAPGFSQGGLDDRLRAIRNLMAHLAGADGHVLGGADMEAALADRSGRCLHDDAVTDHLGPATNPGRRAEALLDLEPLVIGAANKRKLANYVLPILTLPDNELFFLQENGDVSDRLRCLTRLQVKVVASRFQDMHRRQMAEKLDQLNVRIVQGDSLFQRVRDGQGSDVDKGLHLLRLVADGHFTRGKSIAAAREQVLVHLRTRGFLERLAERGEDVAEKTRNLKEFQHLLAVAGIDQTSIATAL